MRKPSCSESSKGLLTLASRTSELGVKSALIGEGGKTRFTQCLNDCTQLLQECSHIFIPANGTA